MTPDLDAIVEHCSCPDHLQARLTDGCPCTDHVHELRDLSATRLAALEGALREAADFLELRPYGHVGPSDIPWFTHGVISHDKVRPDCVVCQWLARYAALTPDPDSEERT